MLDSEADQSMIATMQRVGAEHGLTSIAEHVDRPALLPALAQLGVDCAQGWAVATAQPISRLCV
jgi:EAL domain.